MEKDDQGIMLLAPPDGGKTTTTIGLVREHDFAFLADDMTLTDGQNAYSYPLDLKIENWSMAKVLHLSSSRRLELAIKNAIGQLPLFPRILSGAWFPPSEALGSNRVKDKVEVKYVFFLHRGSQGVMEVESDTALRKLLSLQEYAMLEDSLFQRYLYFTGRKSIEDLTGYRWRLYRELVDGARCFALSGDNESYVRLVSKTLDGFRG